MQRFQVEADGGDRGFQLVRDGVDEGVVLLVAADLAHQESGVQDYADDDDESEQGSEEEEDAGVPAQQHPADVQQNDDGDEAGAERDEEGDGSAAAGNDHDSSLPQPGRSQKSEVRSQSSE